MLMKHTLFLFLAFSIIAIYSCQDEPNNQLDLQTVQVDDFSATQLLFSLIEYDLYIGESKLANNHINNLKNKIADNQKLFCIHESEGLKNLIVDLDMYADQVLKESKDWSLDKLRFLKGQYMIIETKEDYDPYLYHVWKYEEDMYYTTKAAIDPKLDLYEWCEFEMLVEGMNDDWEMVRLHYPSIDLFGNNHLGYKIQTMAKIHLQESMNQFNTAVRSDDYVKYDLCDHGDALRESYIEYIKTFVAQGEELSPFFATL